MSNEQINEIEEEESGLGFWDHVEELRRRIIYSVVGILIGCLIAGVFIGNIMDWVRIQINDFKIIL